MKLVLMLRGVSGSGKSTEARRWCYRALTPVVVSADFYMGRDFNFEKLEECHRMCFSDFEVALSRSHDLIIVDNTNIKAHEVQPYVNKARAEGYEVLIFQLNVDPQLASKRTIHAVPMKTILNQATRLWEERIPDDWEVWHRGRPWAPPRPQNQNRFPKGNAKSNNPRPPKAKGFLAPPRSPEVYHRVRASSES